MMNAIVKLVIALLAIIGVIWISPSEQTGADLLTADLDGDIGCAKNVNGDWVEFNLKSGKHQSKIKDGSNKEIETLATSTPLPLLESFETPQRYVGKKRTAPCVFYGGKSLQARQAGFIEEAQAALSFNDVNTDKVDFNDTYDFDSDADTFTIEFWAKISATGDCDFILSKEANTSGVPSWAFFTADCFEAGDIVWRAGGGNSAERVYCRFDQGGSDIDDGDWHHFAIAHTAGTTCAGQAGYVDGVSRTLTQADTGGANGNNVSDFVFGNNAAANGGCGRNGCSIDEVRIWNYARSANLIAGNMWLRIPDQQGLIGYWRTDEGALSTGVDVFAYSSHASSTNGTITSVDYVDSAPINYPE